MRNSTEVVVNEEVKKLVAEAEEIINDDERRTSRDIQRLTEIRTRIREVRASGGDVDGVNQVIYDDITDRKEVG